VSEEGLEKPSAQESSHNPDDKVAEQSSRAFARYGHLGQQSGHDADYDPENEMLFHRERLSKCRMLLFAAA
jgi:hypothetical protein